MVFNLVSVHLNTYLVASEGGTVPGVVEPRAKDADLWVAAAAAAVAAGNFTPLYNAYPSSNNSVSLNKQKSKGLVCFNY